MNHQHLIDSAIFDTTIAADAASLERQAEIETFIKKDLMQVVDEVLEQVDRSLSDSERVFRIGQLDLDLGEIPFREFRSQMKRKLREQLLSALGDMRHQPGSVAQSEPGPVDTKSAAQDQLFYFLRHGYLPWYSRLEGAEALEALLIETIDNAPGRLVELLLDSEQRAVVVERLQRQFSGPVAERIMRLLPSSEAPVDTHAAQSDAMQAQLVAALLSGDKVLFRTSWQALYDSHAGLLEKTLRQYGQKAIFRHRMVAGLSATQFDDLLRLLEPAAHVRVKAILDVDEIFQAMGDAIPADRAKLEAELGEYVLGFLLVERGSRFDELSFVGSLFRQMVVSSNRGRDSELVAGRSFARNIPWLYIRLNRELRNGNQVWEQAIKGLPVEVLSALVDMFLSRIGPSGATELTDEMPELAAAIESNAAKSKNRQWYYTRIFDRLLRGEHIDFDAIASAEPGGAVAAETEGHALDDTVSGKDIPASSKFAPPELLLSAELLTRASRGTSISLTSAQLDRFKWQIIENYFAETGGLFNLDYFSRQFVETLIRQANVKDAGQFRDRLSRVLLRNSSPSTLDMARKLADLLVDESGDIPVSDASAAVRGTPEDESTPVENIYIANAGAVLFAPYLPRLFERLGLIEEGQFKDRNAAERGVHCVQYLVNESTSSPEYQLVLNKLLCGVRPGRPIRRSIELAADEKEQLESLLWAIIENWKTIGNTSITGLRESFLQRSGRLQLENNTWHLSVEARAFDMLLDQLPWSFSTIKFPWMERIIYVEWR